MQEMKSRGASADELRALLYAHARRFRECVTLLQRMGAEQRALEMFADLRMFEQAQVRDSLTLEGGNLVTNYIGTIPSNLANLATIFKG